MKSTRPKPRTARSAPDSPIVVIAIETRLKLFIAPGNIDCRSPTWSEMQLRTPTWSRITIGACNSAQFTFSYELLLLLWVKIGRAHSGKAASQPQLNGAGWNPTRNIDSNFKIHYCTRYQCNCASNKFILLRYDFHRFQKLTFSRSTMRGQSPLWIFAADTGHPCIHAHTRSTRLSRERYCHSNNSPCPYQRGHSRATEITAGRPLSSSPGERFLPRDPVWNERRYSIGRILPTNLAHLNLSRRPSDASTLIPATNVSNLYTT